MEQIAAEQSTDSPFKVAFIGDTKLKSNPNAVRKLLELVRTERADAVLHGGDLTYDTGTNGPAALDSLVDSILGRDYPFFVTVGNHDAEQQVPEWRRPGGYQDRYEARLTRLGIPWDGDLGVRSSFTYRGVLFVQTAPGLHELADVDTTGRHHADYVRRTLAASQATWRVSSFHRNMNEMQLGDKGCITNVFGSVGPQCAPDPMDTPGWEVYEASRTGGAIIATAHEHSYSRTHTMSRVDLQRFQQPSTPSGIDRRPVLMLAADDPATPIEDEGRSFVFVSGLGGQARSRQRDGEWWGARYTTDEMSPDVSAGALFGVFRYAGDPRLAYFYFKDINGVVVDEFFVRSDVGNGYPVRLTVEGAGAVRPSPFGWRYPAGSTVALTAEPLTGDLADFLGWDGDLRSHLAAVTAMVDRPLTVKARFAVPWIVDAAILSEADDVEEDEKGELDGGDDDLDLSPGRTVGLRFASVELPQGARVTRAWLQLTADDTDSSRLSVRVSVEDSNNARVFDGDRDYDVSARRRLDGPIWNAGPWYSGTAGHLEQSPDLAGEINRIVGRSDWRLGNAIVVILQALPNTTGERDAIAADKTPARSATLHIEFR